MRKWGIVISIFYALILLGLIVPIAIFLTGLQAESAAKFAAEVFASYRALDLWVPAAIILIGEALLLFLSVDTTQRRLKPRTHVHVSIAAGAALIALLATAVIWCLGVALRGDKPITFFDNITKNLFGNDDYLWILWLLIFWGALWLFWAILFYSYLHNSSAVVTRLISWLLKGSVLELLIAIPCHVIVRRRNDCCAPLITSFGIATGLAIMLLSFGPSVLFLYKKRLDAYSTRSV